MRDPRTILVFSLLTVTALAGCLSDGGDDNDPTGNVIDNDPGITTVKEREQIQFDVTDFFSQTLQEGPYEILPGIQFFTDAGLAPTEGVPAAADQDRVSIGIHFPAIEGCDWNADSLPDHCQVPVIADIGPYYASSTGNQFLNGRGTLIEPRNCPVALPLCEIEAILGEGDAPVTEHTRGRLLGFLVENFVPHGYAVAAVSVMGTGDSGHCQDLMGTAEQMGVQAAVEFMGSSAFSNGAVGLIGRSYDGSTPWEAAMAGSPYLKTIVPISGLQGQHDLMWRNGSAELRGPAVLYALYAQMTVDAEAEDPTQVLCPDYQLGGALAPVSYVTGGTQTDAVYDYWDERYFFDDVLANYDGSVYYIHGMQDWNVDPHQAFPYYNILLDNGNDMRGLFGQWAHNYPDRPTEHDNQGRGRGAEAFPESVRYDWAQDLLEWFDHYLKGTGPQPPLHVEVQDNMGGWRIEADYPPRDADVVRLGLDQATRGHTGEDRVIVGGIGINLQELTYDFAPLSETEDTRIAGNVLFHVNTIPQGPGGQLGATLFAFNDTTPPLRLGHAVMDLRYAAGGKDLQPVIPQMPLVAMMEFEAMDVVVPAGYSLRLVVGNTVEDYLPAVTSTPVDIDVSAASVLKLPTVDPSPDTFFVPPIWWEYDEDGNLIHKTE